MPKTVSHGLSTLVLKAGTDRLWPHCFLEQMPGATRIAAGGTWPQPPLPTRVEAFAFHFALYLHAPKGQETRGQRVTAASWPQNYFLELTRSIYIVLHATLTTEGTKALPKQSSACLVFSSEGRRFIYLLRRQPQTFLRGSL